MSLGHFPWQACFSFSCGLAPPSLVVENGLERRAQALAEQPSPLRPAC